MNTQMKIILSLILFFVVVIGIVFFVSQKKESALSGENTQPINEIPATSTQVVGGDKDAHGCIGSAGYTWCEIKQKCLRVWEEKCEATSTPPKKDETANWETYKNIEQGFQFKYPSSATLVKDTETYLSLASGAKIYIYVGKNTSVPLMGAFGGRFEYDPNQKPDFLLFSEIGGVFTRDYFIAGFGGGTSDRVLNAYKEKDGNVIIFSLYNPLHNPKNGNTTDVFLNEMRDGNNPDVALFRQILFTATF